jgi:hypothetical protein
MQIGFDNRALPALLLNEDNSKALGSCLPLFISVGFDIVYQLELLRDEFKLVNRFRWRTRPKHHCCWSN